MNRELKNIYEKYVRDNQVNISAFCNKKDATKIVTYLFKATPFNYPDFYYVNNRCCYIYEHFEIDASSRSNTKGSLYLRNKSEAEREIELEANKLIYNSQNKIDKITSVGTICKTVAQNANVENLENNFTNIFDKHYQQIENYKNNLKSQAILAKQNIKTIFIIEHTTELGGFYFNNSIVRLELQLVNFVLKKIEQSPKVDYFIFLDISNEERRFIVLKNGNLDKIKKLKIDTDVNRIYFFNDIHNFSQTIVIPHSELQIDNDNK